jgi:hypothetical protein
MMRKQLEEKIALLYKSKIPKPPTTLPIPPPLDIKPTGPPPIPKKSGAPPPPPSEEKLPVLPNQGPPKPPPPQNLPSAPLPPPALTGTVLKGSDIPPPPAKTLTAEEVARKMIEAFLPKNLKAGVSTDDPAVKGMIDNIWEQYDADKSGELDKEETRAFIKDTYSKLPSGTGSYDEAQFNDVFNTFDTDGSGTIEKNEMIGFLKKILNLTDPTSSVQQDIELDDTIYYHITTVQWPDNYVYH